MKDGSKLKCPMCGEKLNVLDDPDNFLYEVECPSCGWSDDKAYYDFDGEAVLMSKEEAYKKGFRFKCEVCGKELTEYEVKAYGVCENCYFNEEET